MSTVIFSPTQYIPNMSPCAHYSTPPHSSSVSYDSPMLTPSPLRRRQLFPPPVDDPEQDDIFLQSPFKSPPVHRLSYKQPLSIDDDEGNFFLSPSSPATSPFLPLSTSRPLRTPVKEQLRSKPQSVLKSTQSTTHPQVPTSVTRAAVGTKRKSSAGAFSTPLRQSISTPLSISAAKADPASGVAFHRLAPLPAPLFGTRTPQSKAETDAYLKGQAETMKRLRIRDMENSDEEWGVIVDDDSACEAEEQKPGKKPFSTKLPLLSRRSKNQLCSPRKPLTIKAIPQKGSFLDEVTEAISPGGHILKRRARSRPVSLELLESVNQSPSTPASFRPDTSSPNHRRASKLPVTFPSVDQHQSSVSHPSPAGDSAMPRRRLNGGTGPHPLPANTGDPVSRSPMKRLTSTSSASIFFGPSIPQTKSRSRTASNAGIASGKSRISAHTLVCNRRSFAGAGSEAIAPFPWRSSLNVSSPDSSPHSLPHGGFGVVDDEDDMFFEPCDPPETSFVFSVTEGTPSPRSKKTKDMLPLKYKPRDSGIAFSDDEDAPHSTGTSRSAMPQTSTSTSSVNSDVGDDLITPGLMPDSNSGWPAAFVVHGSDDSRTHDDAVDADAFILRTLAAAGKPSAEESKKPPGTPVKKLKNAHLGNRPWQSAVAAKVGFSYGGLDLAAAPAGKIKNGPRKSLPAAFPPLCVEKVPDLQGSDDDEDEENSPSTRKEANRYEGLGLGRPPHPSGPAGPVERTRWLMRRSSSGAFSTGSDTSLATPTRRNKDWPVLPRIPTHISPFMNNQVQITSEKPGSRSSSNSSVVTLNSPTRVRRQVAGFAPQRLPVSPLHQHASSAVNDKQGRFDKEFVEVDQIGSGEFGKVLKVRSKNGPLGQVWAVKRSKPFEGSKHRLRLREEVDVLQHLSRAAATDGGHPNVLAYIDSWEEDEALFIRTELCELGNFARFLWEYGKVLPRLNEARVWKVFADLSNGLRFIHESGVIHLDLKPANIFLTQEGRFKIGDFGMASLWPRTRSGSPLGVSLGGFEREGDKVYLAREVLQGTYGKAADIFSLGMTMLETATNIVVPDQGDGWHRLRQEDFSQVDLDASPELFDLIKRMMRTDPGERVDIQTVHSHPVIRRVRFAMERVYSAAKTTGSSVFAASPLASVPDTFLDEILCRRTTAPDYEDDVAMDLSL